MRLKRFFWFMVAILVGAAGGLTYGWLINPVRYVDTPLTSLRADYKADWTLMVAELYEQEGDLAVAESRLASIDVDPLAQAQQALQTGRQLGYPDKDIELLVNLVDDLATAGAKP